MQFKRQGFCHLDVIEPGRGIAVRVGDEFHQQDAIGTDKGRGHANARVRQPEQGIDFRSLPELFLYFTTVAAALFHGALLTAILHLAPFHIACGLPEAALLDVLVDLCATDFTTTANDIDGGFFAAH